MAQYMEEKLLCGWQAKGDTLSRFTQRQYDIYRRSNLSSVAEINRTSGMKLDFITGEAEIAFSFTCRDFLRGRVCFDIYEDGIYRQTAVFPDHTPAGRVTYTRRSHEESRLEIYLPNSCDTSLTDLQLGQIGYSPRCSKKYIAFGDSITQGLDSEKPSVVYPTLIAREMGLELLNQGVGGYVFDSRVIEKIPGFSPDIVTVAYGVNDCNLILNGELSFSGTEKEAGLFFETCRRVYPEAEVIAVTPVAWSCEKRQPHRDAMRRVRDMITSLAREAGCGTADGLRILPPNPEYFTPDGVHPNAAGFRVYAQNLLRIIG